jgi:hypothetical protein
MVNPVRLERCYGLALMLAQKMCRLSRHLVKMLMLHAGSSLKLDVGYSHMEPASKEMILKGMRRLSAM